VEWELSADDLEELSTSQGVLIVSFIRLLNDLLNNKNALHDYNPFYRNTCFIYSITHNPTLVSCKHNIIGALPSTPSSLVVQKLHVKHVFILYTNFISSPLLA
jgi:hypothetical protein